MKDKKSKRAFVMRKALNLPLGRRVCCFILDSEGDVGRVGTNASSSPRPVPSNEAFGGYAVVTGDLMSSSVRRGARREKSMDAKEEGGQKAPNEKKNNN